METPEPVTGLGALLILGVTLSIDNVRVALSLGATGVGGRLALRFAVAFAAFEAVMPLAGLGLGAAFSNALGRWAEAFGAFALAGAGVYVVVSTLRGVETGSVFGRTWMVFGLPMSLSIDNLAAGFGLGVLGLPVVASAVTLGVISGSMCFAAFRFGDWIARLVPARIEALGGLALFAIAASSLVGLG